LENLRRKISGKGAFSKLLWKDVWKNLGKYVGKPDTHFRRHMWRHILFASHCC